MVVYIYMMTKYYGEYTRLIPSSTFESENECRTWNMDGQQHVKKHFILVVNVCSDA